MIPSQICCEHVKNQTQVFHYSTEMAIVSKPLNLKFHYIDDRYGNHLYSRHTLFYPFSLRSFRTTCVSSSPIYFSLHASNAVHTISHLATVLHTFDGSFDTSWLLPSVEHLLICQFSSRAHSVCHAPRAVSTQTTIR